MGSGELHRGAEYAQHPDEGACGIWMLGRKAYTPLRQIREGMTVISTLDASDPKTKVNREILLALFTPLGKCRLLEEKVRCLPPFDLADPKC